MESYKARAVLDELLGAADAKAALRQLALGADDDGADAFERYAGLVLRDAGALALTDTTSPPIRIRLIAEGQLVRLFNPSAPPGSIHRRLQALEGALNRLLGVRNALENGIGARTAAAPGSSSSLLREKYARHGIEYPLWSDPTRGAHVTLPPLAPGEVPSLAYYGEVDWRMLDNVASIAHLHYQSTILANRNQVVFGVKGPHGSEWDVRTRLASTLGNLWLSLRPSYRFDCDLSRGVTIVHFTIPPAECFPALVPSLLADELKPTGDRMDTARTVYALRLAALVAAACFGAGRPVECATVVGEDALEGPVVSCTFERIRFVHDTLPAIDAGRLSDPAVRFNPDETERIMAPTRSERADASAHELPRATLASTRVIPGEDTRVLPDHLQLLFHAKRVCDIDVSHRPDKASRILEEAKDDAQRFTAAAIASLEELVDELEESLAPPDDQPDARPLHCESAERRLAVALLDEELSIGADAEAFLGLETDGPAALPDVYYYRAPGALFPAHAELAGLYQAIGDHQAAERRANRCIALAPTTPAGYVLKADALSKMKRSREAANVIVEGLRCALSDGDRARLMHDLALVVRRLGHVHESEALHICASSLNGPSATASLDIVRDFAGGSNVRAFVQANLPEATAIVAGMGIPARMEHARGFLLAQATLGLTDMHAPNAAAPYAALLADLFPTNRAIISACKSIQQGTE